MALDLNFSFVFPKPPLMLLNHPAMLDNQERRQSMWTVNTSSISTKQKKVK
jgi:hypothetical protein